MSDSAWQGNNGHDKSDIQPSPPLVPVTPATPTPRQLELESIKRTLYNAINKVEQLQRRESGALTTT